MKRARFSYPIILTLLAAILAFASADDAQTHAFAPSLLELSEVESDRFRVRWKQPTKRVLGSSLKPILPDHCEILPGAESYREGTGIVSQWEALCEGGLVDSEVGVEGLRSARSGVVLRIALAEGPAYQTLLGPDDGVFRVPGEKSVFQVGASYMGLGFDHILSGFDHLLFVLCLVILVGGGRMLLWTITAFTVGHSITLALAVLELIVIPQAPIEAAIALSIVFLAAEIVRNQQGETTMIHRAPWAVAGAFGLLHGLGFAGALAEIGLPPNEIPLALFSFNVGIEFGQLFFVALVLVGWWLLRKIPFRWPLWSARVPAYAIGTLSAFWFFERSLSWLGEP